MKELNNTNMNILIDIVKKRVARAENAVVRDFFAQQGIEGEAAEKAEAEYRRRMNGGFSAINPDDYRPHGRWIPLEYDGCADGNPVWDLWECSECREEHSGDEDTLTPYCPNCGAKMDGKENDE